MVINEFNKNVLSWKNSMKFLFLLQKRLFKSVYLGDNKVSLKFQKLILKSSCARLLAIREVTQVSLNKKIAGSDGKTSLTFLERFELNELLKNNFNKWIPQSLKKILILEKNGNIKSFKIATIADRAWKALVKFAIEPAHEAVFNPSNFGFRSHYSVYDVQKIISLKLDSTALGKQKRILMIKLPNTISCFDHNFLVKKIIAPRSIKIGIFRLIKKGFVLDFEKGLQEPSDLINLLFNILLDGIENLHESIRFNSDLIYFLNPIDDEKTIFQNLNSFLVNLGLDSENVVINFGSSLKGFDFLGWHFKFSLSKGFFSTPSFDNYQIFLKRVKRIVNNSNYGSKIKANKLYPVVKDWRTYHRYSFMQGARFSLFFIKKRAFKVFNKEAKQDFYSTKNLLDKSFYILNSIDHKLLDKEFLNSPYYGHMTFWMAYSDQKNKSLIDFICIHCGMNFYYYS